MKKYKVTRIKEYTEVAYVEASNVDEAINVSDKVECVPNDDMSIDYNVIEITDEEYKSAGE